MREPERVRKPSRSYPAIKFEAAPGAAERGCSQFAKPVPDTLAETYLRGRCDYRPPRLAFLAISSGLLVPRTTRERPDNHGPLCWEPSPIPMARSPACSAHGSPATAATKPCLPDPRRAMGRLLGNAVRFGEPAEVMAAGEGIETVLSLLSLFPALPMAAGLSAAHLAAIQFPARPLPSVRSSRQRRRGRFCRRPAHAEMPRGGRRLPVLKPAAKDLNADLRRRPVR